MPVIKKESTVTLRVTPVRKALYREIAAAEGMWLSAWLRHLADHRVMERSQDGIRPNS